jgi:hypothetical protein
LLANSAAKYQKLQLKFKIIRFFWGVSRNCGDFSMDFRFIGFLDDPRISKIEDEVKTNLENQLIIIEFYLTQISRAIFAWIGGNWNLKMRVLYCMLS